MTLNTITVSEADMQQDKAELIDRATIGTILLLSAITTIVGLLQDQPFWAWAWARHQNALSWVVRPLTIPLYAYFAYRRNLLGLFATIIGIATSMYWFPIPTTPNPDIANFLYQEQQYLTTGWTAVKIIWSSLVPITMGALAVAFWRQSVFSGLIVINGIAFLKITWSITEDSESGWILIPFAIIGLLITDAIIIYVAKKRGISILTTS